MIRQMAATAVLALAATGVWTGAASAAQSTNWTGKTCAAFSSWEQHPTTDNLDTLMADSFHVPWRYLGNDAAGLYTDVRSGAPAKYIANDKKYLHEDC
jgi:hypothetical protein